MSVSSSWGAPWEGSQQLLVPDTIRCTSTCEGERGPETGHPPAYSLRADVLVTAANESDTAASVTPLSRIAAAHPHPQGLWATGHRSPSSTAPAWAPTSTRPTSTGRQGVHGHSKTLDHRAEHQVAHASPTPHP